MKRHARPAGHENAFDILRLTAAYAVLYSHSFALLGLPEPQLFGHSLGTVAVYVFFSISGYLVCQSWQNAPDLSAFLAKRALRIYPGLAVALVATTFVLGPLATTLTAPAYFTDRSTWAYLLQNLATLAGPVGLPGAFHANPFPVTVNGSLWTLQYEVALYLWLALLASWVDKTRWAVLLLTLLTTFSVAWLLLTLNLPGRTSMPLPVLWRAGIALNADFFNFGVFFFVGGLLHACRDKLALSVAAALGSLAVVTGMFWLTNAGLASHVLLWWLIPYATVVAAFRLPRSVSRITGGWDISYGVYVYAFPIQQLLAAALAKQPWAWPLSLVAAFCLTSFAAMISWQTVERPALRLKRVFIKAPKAAQG